MMIKELLKEKNDHNEPKLIVSLTSFPKRISTVHLTIQTLQKQTKMPDKIILWLAKEQFSDTKELPSELTCLLNDVFDIRWCDDLKSHKKYYYTFIKFPNDCIITVDDDCLYPSFIVEMLYNSYKKYPMAISTIRGRVIDWNDDGSLKSYDNWVLADKDYIGIPAMDLLPIGCGGVLYPPHLVNKEVLNRSYILNHCIKTDDLWLKIMHAINNVPTVLVSEYFHLDFIDGTQENALWVENISGINEQVMSQLIYDYNDFRDDGMKLIDILQGKYGVSIGKQMAQKKSIEKKKYMKILMSKNHLIIYGAGYYARKTYKILKNNGINILCFAVSDISDNPQLLDNVNVYEINQIKEYAASSMVVVAVDPLHHSQIIDKLTENGFNQYFLVNDIKLKTLS
ncbi:MAG TPA: hypothetical protein GXZ21_06165 [Clostridiales bacterium]|nr:hypothetical protein [Clostridiales bacterium]